MPPKVQLFYPTGVPGANRMDLSRQVDACGGANEGKVAAAESTPYNLPQHRCPAALFCIAVLAILAILFTRSFPWHSCKAKKF
jgi:hypothetical protein